MQGLGCGSPTKVVAGRGWFLEVALTWSPPTGYLPNSVYAVEAMLAAASIGAIWSSTSPDFGVNVSRSLRYPMAGGRLQNYPLGPRGDLRVSEPLVVGSVGRCPLTGVTL